MRTLIYENGAVRHLVVPFGKGAADQATATVLVSGRSLPLSAVDGEHQPARARIATRSVAGLGIPPGALPGYGKPDAYAGPYVCKVAIRHKQPTPRSAFPRGSSLFIPLAP